MAYTSCAGSLAKNIQVSCDNPNVGGYTGRGVLIPVENLGTITVDADNKHIITNIALQSGKKLCAIANLWTEAFTGSTTASSNENGRVLYDKSFAFRIPLRGAAVSKDIVEPLMDSPLGFVAVLEKKYRGGDGSYEVVGYQDALTADPDSITRNEYENGGDITATLSCSEPWFEVTLFDTDYATTQALFETMLDNAF